MQEVGAGLGLVGFIIVLILALYPYLALGRIWLYSKQQVEFLREIRNALQRANQPSGQSSTRASTPQS